MTEAADVESTLFGLAEKVGRRLRKNHFRGNTVCVKVRYANRKIRTAQKHLSAPTNNELIYFPACKELLSELWVPGTPMRLLGVAVSSLESDEDHSHQFQQNQSSLSLFEEEEQKKIHQENVNRKLESLLSSTDAVKNRFGESSIQYGIQQIKKGTK